MTEMPQQRHSWSVWFASAVIALPAIYFLVSGPLRGYGNRWGVSLTTFNQCFAPLVWLEENTSAKRPIQVYWGLFPDSYGHETDGLTKWINSPKAGAINRNLGFE